MKNQIVDRPRAGGDESNCFVKGGGRSFSNLACSISILRHLALRVMWSGHDSFKRGLGGGEGGRATSKCVPPYCSLWKIKADEGTPPDDLQVGSTDEEAPASRPPTPIDGEGGVRNIVGVTVESKLLCEKVRGGRRKRKLQRCEFHTACDTYDYLARGKKIKSALSSSPPPPRTVIGRSLGRSLRFCVRDVTKSQTSTRVVSLFSKRPPRAD